MKKVCVSTMFKAMDKDVKRRSLIFLVACYFLYTVSICIKMVYSAEMAEIIIAVGAAKSEVSLGLLFYYVSYCIGQLLFACFLNKINLKWFVSGSVLMTAISFGMMLVAGELWQMYLILFLNGFFQTGVWGGVMFYVGKYVPREMSGFVSKFLTTGFTIGTALTYGASALFIAVGSWRYTFVFFSVLSVISIFTFLWSLKLAAKNEAYVTAERKAARKAEVPKEAVELAEIRQSKTESALFLVIFFTVICSLLSCVYYAFTNWFPSLLMENFNMPSEYSILFTLILPLATVPSSFMIIGIQEKSKSNYRIALIFMAVVAAFILSLTFGYKLNIVLTLVLSVTMLFFLRAVMTLFSTYMPLLCSDKIEVGKFSLIINAFTALMAGVMPYISSFVLERVGWGVYFIILSTLICVLLVMLAAARIAETKNRL